ncbi:hypothetical+protein [Methylocapsa aurea]|uniref:hypothetical protein n=1 Tax=Methylocapsa aurea TaxID=663610 RepID=UPI003D18BF74
MNTDWNLIRKMLDAAVDACEQIEAAGYCEADRGATTNVRGQDVSVWEFLISAWTLPENVRYRIIRERHERDADLPYVPESARIIMSMAQACAELIGAAEARPAEAEIQQMIHWYEAHAVPGIKRAIEDERLRNGARS